MHFVDIKDSTGTQTILHRTPYAFNPIQNKPNSLEHSLTLRGYTAIKSIADALQGSIWSVVNNKTTAINIIKAVSKQLSNNKITYYHNKAINTKENITKERDILRYLSANNPPLSLTKYIDSFEDMTHYYLVMEHGGNRLFEFVQKCHGFIAQGVLSLDTWRVFCKQAMKQIVSLMEWLHNTMNCCHLDISLENFVINNVQITMNAKTNKILQFNDKFQIKIIDFGLAEVFTTKNSAGYIDFSCAKYVGKTSYKSPKVYGKKEIFDARSADCWSLAVCFFMMIIGSPPFHKASSEDALFCAIMNGKLVSVLRAWKRMNYVSQTIVDLMNKLFVEEQYRLNIKEIQNHTYFLE